MKSDQEIEENIEPSKQVCKLSHYQI